ncbi:MAG: hypothetical protein ABIY55_34690 [Kofleriaceae bacterium]
MSRQAPPPRRIRAPGGARWSHLVWAVMLSAACSGRSSPPVAGAQVGLALAAALTAADAARAPWPCAAADGPSVADETLTLGTRTWQLGARTMKLDATGEVAIGVIADAAGSAPATLAALGRLRSKLARVDLVVSLGGMGATRAELDATFAALADHASWPLVALPGDLEPVVAQAEAVAAARQRGAVVLDGRLLQRIELPGATIALLPGAGAASRLVAGAEGCAFGAAEIAAVFAELTPRAGLRILASAEAPRQDAGGPASAAGGQPKLSPASAAGGDQKPSVATGDPRSADPRSADEPNGDRRTGDRRSAEPRSADEPTGDLAITAGDGRTIDVALHGPTNGPIHGAATGARRGNRDGLAVSVTPGSSDAMPGLPGATRLPSAGVLTVRGTAWSWQPIEDVK